MTQPRRTRHTVNAGLRAPTLALHSLQLSTAVFGLVLSGALLLGCVTAPLAAQEGLNGYAEEVEEMLEEWGVPGLAVAVVQDDEVTFSQGFGAREVGGNEPVDENTIFAVGSTSKAFTAAAIAMLVDEETVAWDDRVTTHLPNFQLYDPYVTREMRVRDLMSHNSGLLRGDRIWYGSGRSREEVLHQARYQPLTYSLRSTFQYNNIMWIAAGELIEELSGTSWDQFVEDRIFSPLGMDQSTTLLRPLATMENVAKPHIELPDGTLKTVPFRNIDNAGPAGSINSSALQMAQWVRVQLGLGEYEGTRLVSESAVQEMHTGQMIMRAEGQWGLIFPASDFLTYGLGWFLSDYRDLKMVSHGGNIDGMTAFVGFVPERGYGFVFLANLNGANAFISALAHRTIDRLEGGEGRAWSEEMLEVWNGFVEEGRKAAAEVEEKRVAGTSPTLDIAAYVGTYHSDMYGDIEVVKNGTGLRASFGAGFHGPLEHWHYDTFRALWEDPSDPKEFFRFEVGSDGEVETLNAEIEGSVEFKKQTEEGG